MSDRVPDASGNGGAVPSLRRAEILAAAFDQLDDGVMLLDALGRVMFSNRVARELLAANDGLRLVHGVLRPEHPAEDRALQSLVREAARRSAAVRPDPSAAGHAGAEAHRMEMPITRRPPSTALLVSVLPLWRPGADGPHAPAVEPCAAVMLLLHDRVRLIGANILRACVRFRLTPAESRLARLMVEGWTPQQVAECLGVSVATVRAHLKNLFRKTGGSGQSDLIRILLGAGGGTARKPPLKAGPTS